MRTRLDDTKVSSCKVLSHMYGDGSGAAWSASLARGVCIDLRNARTKTATGNLTSVFESDM